MASTSRALEVTIISGEDLRINKKPVKRNSYVIVNTDAAQNAGKTTDADKDGGSYPTWNKKLDVDLFMHARFLTVEVHSKTSAGDKIIGCAVVPVSDFIGGYVPESHLHFLSYRLRDNRGERNGIINISVRVKGVPERVCSSSETRIGLPLGVDNIGGGIVTGIPVWCTSYPKKV